MRQNNLLYAFECLFGLKNTTVDMQSAASKEGGQLHRYFGFDGNKVRDVGHHSVLGVPEETRGRGGIAMVNHDPVLDLEERFVYLVAKGFHLAYIANYWQLATT